MKSKARVLRKSSTDAEKMLWQSLRYRQLDGWKFRRQHPIGLFIVDFACVEGKLVVEVDGGQHAFCINEDLQRSDYLRSKGYRLLRFWNNQVLQEAESVLDVILSSLSEDVPLTPTLSPDSGERGN